MNTPLSLVQELRGIRGGQKHSQADLEALLTEIREARREWQEQVDQAQSMLHELLGAVAELSGVELPGIAKGAQREGDSSLRLGFKTLKDRIKNELEGYASTSAAEVAKMIHGKGQILLEPLEKEASQRMDNLAGEFRGKLESRLEAEQNEVVNQARLRAEEMLQGKMNEFAEWIKLMTDGIVSSVPAEVQKSLGPHIEQVRDRLRSTFEQQLNVLVMESERASQAKVESIKNEVQSLLGGLAEQARQACSTSTDQAMRDFNSRLSAVMQDSARQFETASKSHTDESVNKFKGQVEGLTESSRAQFQSFADSHVSSFREKLQATALEMQQKSATEIASQVQKASQDALNTSLSQVRQRVEEALEQSKGELKSTMGTMVDDVRKQMGEFALNARDSLAGDATRLSDNLRSLGEQLRAAETQRINALAESMTNLSRQTLEGHAKSVKQVADMQIDEIRKSLSSLQSRMAIDYESQVRQFVENERRTIVDEIQKQVADASANAVERIRSSSGQVVQDLSGKVNKEVNTATTLLNQWAHQTTTWAEASIKESLESYKRQVAEFTNTLLEEQRSNIQGKIGDLQGRLEQAANLLRVAGEPVTNPQPESNQQKV
jgi:hypothetical protein